MDRETERQKDRKTERQKGRKTKRHWDRKTERKTERHLELRGSTKSPKMIGLLKYTSIMSITVRLEGRDWNKKMFYFVYVDVPFFCWVNVLACMSLLHLSFFKNKQKTISLILYKLKIKLFRQQKKIIL